MFLDTKIRTQNTIPVIDVAIIHATYILLVKVEHEVSAIVTCRISLTIYTAYFTVSYNDYN